MVKVEIKPTLRFEFGALSDSHLAMIGKIAVFYAMLEYGVSNALANLLRLGTKESMEVIPRMQFSAVQASLRSLLLLSRPEEAERIQNLFKLIADAQAQRNRVMHGLWWGVKYPPEFQDRSLMTSAPKHGKKPNKADVHTDKTLKAAFDSVFAAHAVFIQVSYEFDLHGKVLPTSAIPAELLPPEAPE